jgi:hypothetical protein
MTFIVQQLFASHPVEKSRAPASFLGRLLSLQLGTQAVKSYYGACTSAGLLALYLVFMSNVSCGCSLSRGRSALCC